MSREFHLTTPISDADLKEIRVGDIVYLDGTLVTCRDVAHRRLVELGRPIPVELRGNAIFHAGPIVREREDGGYEMVSIGPTTSMRMELFEQAFIAETGVKLIIGKGGMAEKTEAACREHQALHAVFPGGCAVVAAECVEEIREVHWKELGMPEALWVCRVKDFGPLIISIDCQGNNLFRRNRTIYQEKKEEALEQLLPHVRYIK